MNNPHLALLAALLFWLISPPVLANQLNIICSNDPEWCKLMAQSFEKDTGIAVEMHQRSSGEALAQVRSESGNPSMDVWWGGTSDPHLIAAAEGLTQPSGADTSALLGWAINMVEMSGGSAIGIHAGALGIAYNTDVLAKNKLPAPACWRDLVNPVYSGLIQLANPNSSGTAYTQLATLVQIFGENDAFYLLAEIGWNVSFYTSSGSAPSKAAARGDTAISVGFMHDMAKLIKAGYPLEIVSPCEGTGYEIGGVSIIDGTHNFEASRRWVDYVLSKEAQALAPQVDMFNVPSNANVPLPPESPALESIKLIDYDFFTYGASETRARLLTRWDTEVDPFNRTER
ncbi:MAG: ABC transporter substrate-binding protein [Rhodobacteraceae bacterium]|nr:ABC transporter substrate-binding protein [Paracoccaceae bacterium]